MLCVHSYQMAMMEAEYGVKSACLVMLNID